MLRSIPKVQSFTCVLNFRYIVNAKNIFHQFFFLSIKKVCAIEIVTLLSEKFQS